MEKIILSLVGLLGIFMVLSGIRVLFNHNFGIRAFTGWDSLRNDIARVIVTSLILVTSSFTPQSNILFIAGCFLVLATILFFVMGWWQKGRDFGQSLLIESHQGQRIYVLCAWFPVGILLIIGAFFS